MKRIFFHSISSRSASSARRSAWLDSVAIAASSASGIGSDAYASGLRAANFFICNRFSILSPRLRIAAQNRTAARVGTRPNQLAHQPMHNQVRVPPDRRGEVRIARAGQREVALIFLAVARLLQRPQHQVAQDPLLRLARNLRRQPLIHLRRHGDRLGDLVRLRLRPRPPPLAPRRASRRSDFIVICFTGRLANPSE